MFLFDEPNSALTAEESDELFREMHKLAGSGRIVVLITHRLTDLVSHCARVAVVRDGRVRTILAGEALTEDGLARQLVTESGVAGGCGRARQGLAEGRRDRCFPCAAGRMPGPSATSISTPMAARSSP